MCYFLFPSFPFLVPSADILLHLIAIHFIVYRANDDVLCRRRFLLFAGAGEAPREARKK
jgi:hypothetical protein